jgi:integrase
MPGKVGRPPLRVGSHGRINVTHVGPSKYAARANYRADDGKLYRMTRYADTKGRAVAALEAAFDEWKEQGGHIPIIELQVRDLATIWLADVLRSDRAVQTKQHYSYTVARYVTPHLGSLRVREATTGAVDKALRLVAETHGAAAARSMRAVLNGMFKEAAKHGLRVNPVRETSAITRRAKSPARALTRAEVDTITDGLRADPQALQADLPDLVDFMLATGVRIGEALAVRDSVLSDGAVEINATVVRIKGEGLRVQERPKTASGWRILALPPYVSLMIERRRAEVRFAAAEGVLFPSPYAPTLRDPSNTQSDLRQALDRLGVDKKITSHTFRKTVATRLDEAGWSARQIADQLGHAQPSMTLDVYMGRRVVGADAARILDR